MKIINKRDEITTLKSNERESLKYAILIKQSNTSESLKCAKYLRKNKLKKSSISAQDTNVTSKERESLKCAMYRRNDPI